MRSSAGSSGGGSFGSATTRRERLRRLTPADALAGLSAVLLLPAAALALRRFGLGRVQSALAQRSGSPSGPADHDAALRLAWVVETAARRGLWPANCLQRSVVLWWFMLRRGLPGELRIGVRRHPGSPPGSDELDFHAWVELEGTVLNDLPDIRSRFATFDRAIAPRTATWR